MKTCIKCGIDKPLSEYGTYKGRKGQISQYNQCKACVAAYKNKHYQENKEKYLERSRQQKLDDPEGYKAYLKKYHQENKETLREKRREYSRSPEGREAKRRARENYRSNPENREKERIRSITLHKLKHLRPDKCEMCKLPKPVEAHHEDYNKPLQVTWLCKSCHESVHHLNEGDKSI